MYSSEGAIITPIVIILIMIYMFFFTYFFEDYNYQLQMHYYVSDQSKGELTINKKAIEEPKPIVGYGKDYNFKNKNIISDRVINVKGEYLFSKQKFKGEPIKVSKEEIWFCNDYIIWGIYDFWKNKY